MASAVQPSSSAAAVERQFPQIDMSNPAESFFSLIRDGKYQDSDTEYGAKTVAREYGIIVVALRKSCNAPTFLGQTVAEQMIERLLEEVDNPSRFRMARQMVLTMRDQDFETQFARMAEITCYLANANSDADGMIGSILQEPKAMEFAETLVKSYEGRPALAEIFNNLVVNMRRVRGDAVDDLAEAVNQLEVGDEEAVPTAAASGAAAPPVAQVDVFDPLANQDKRV
jgi:hypothetical protein